MQNTAPPQTFLRSADVLARYRISKMTLHRWQEDAEIGFPRATYIRKRRYWKLADLVAWDESRAVKEAAA